MGEYTDNKKNGKGRLIFSDKSFYDGTFKNDEFDGYGIFRNKKYIYEGQFLSGKKNGRGKLTDFIKNYQYEGEFKDDLKNGYGIEKYSDGSIYKGQFKDNFKEGKGKLTIKDKENNKIEYIGEFKKDKLYGKGIINWSDKKQYFGELNNNEISGFGILKDEKSQYIGFFKNDKKNGYGATFYPDQNFVVLGYWENNNIEGITIIFSIKENILGRENEEYNDNIDNKNEKIINMSNGEIVNMNINEEELNQIRRSENYKELIKIYKFKFLKEYYKNGINFKKEEDL